MFFSKQHRELPKPNDQGSFILTSGDGIFPIRGEKLVAQVGEGKYMLAIREGIVTVTGLNGKGNIRAFDTPEEALTYYLSLKEKRT